MMQNSTRKIGVTGGTGSGKTTVSKIILDNGGYVIDADIISRKIIEIGKPAYRDIIAWLGESILNNDFTIDRKKLGKIVFADKNSLIKLNQITHKHIIEKIKYEFDYIMQNYKHYKYIVLDAALLFELKLNNLVDEVWFITANIETRIDRIIARDNLSRQDAINRIQSQLNIDKFKSFADVIIFNEDIELIKLLVDNMLKE